MSLENSILEARLNPQVSDQLISFQLGWAPLPY